MFKYIVASLAMVLMATQTAEGRSLFLRMNASQILPRDIHDFFQPPVPYEGCCITRGIIPDVHYGIDIACGQERLGVGAMGDGDLIASCDGQAEGEPWTPCGQGGNYVLIKYIVWETPLFVYYYHLTQGSVTKAAPGTRLKKGEIVGNMGSTGSSTGIHLDVTSQQTQPTEPGKYNLPVVDFRDILEMNHWPACG